MKITNDKPPRRVYLSSELEPGGWVIGELTRMLSEEFSIVSRHGNHRPGQSEPVPFQDGDPVLPEDCICTVIVAGERTANYPEIDQEVRRSIDNDIGVLVVLKPGMDIARLSLPHCLESDPDLLSRVTTSTFPADSASAVRLVHRAIR